MKKTKEDSTGKKKDDRVRNWAFIQYDDSAPENWRSILNDEKTPWVESPLHDADLNATGEQKKTHRHIIMAFDSKKSFQQVQEISNKISGCKVEKVGNMKGYVRYLAHLDNPEKAQYNPDDIKCHCGFDKEMYLRKSSNEVRETLQNIFRFIRENDIQSYAEFIDMTIEQGLDEWFDIATLKNTLTIKEYIRSYAFMHPVIDEETGEKKYVGNYLYLRGRNYND